METNVKLQHGYGIQSKEASIIDAFELIFEAFDLPKIKQFYYKCELSFLCIFNDLQLWHTSTMN